VISQMSLALPLVALYEGSIWSVRFVRYPPSRRPRPARLLRRRPARPERRSTGRAVAAHPTDHTSRATPAVVDSAGRQTWPATWSFRRRPPRAAGPLPRGRHEPRDAPAHSTAPAAHRAPASHPPRLAPILAARLRHRVAKIGRLPHELSWLSAHTHTSAPACTHEHSKRISGTNAVLTVASPALGRATTAN